MVITSEFIAPQSPVMCEQRDTKAILNNQDLGLGTLYVSERTLCWQQQEGNTLSQGFTVEYKDITAHAVANDANVYPQECLYILMDKEEGCEGDAEDAEEGYSECGTSELILVPSDQAAINLVYNALNHAQFLNPDPADESDVDSLFEDAEDYNGLNDHYDVGGGGDSEMNALLNQMQSHSVCNGFHDHTDEEQFEDAD